MAPRTVEVFRFADEDFEGPFRPQMSKEDWGYGRRGEAAKEIRRTLNSLPAPTNDGLPYPKGELFGFTQEQLLNLLKDHSLDTNIESPDWPWRRWLWRVPVPKKCVQVGRNQVMFSLTHPDMEGD